jgi:sulfur-oxidizing protein SoxZ
MRVARISLPAGAKRGEIIQIRAIISHPMETGHRRDFKGVPIARDIITEVTAHYDGADIFRAELFPAMAAYPYLAFHTRATVTGPVTFRWRGDNGFDQTQTATLVVTG